MMGSAEMQKTSVVQVCERALYDAGAPRKWSPLDPRMGVCGKDKVCETCGEKLTECVGHFGVIELALPVFHIGCMKNIQNTLQCICKSCSRLLLPDAIINKHLNKMRTLTEQLKRKAAAKVVLEACKKVKRCPHCDAVNGQIKKKGGMGFGHDIYSKKAGALNAVFEDSCTEALKHNSQMSQHIGKVMEDMNPQRAVQLFQAMLDEDCEVLDLEPVGGRPEKMILQSLLVPPVCIRPNVATGPGRMNEDDLTMMLGEIVHINSTIDELVEKGAPIHTLVEDWQYLQEQIAMYLNSECPGLGSTVQSKGTNSRGLSQRLKGKTGRFRGNLSGKRVDFSGRTVISPDPNLSIIEVAVPLHMAKVFTYPEMVNEHNIDRLRQLVRNGPQKHPGANYVNIKDRRFFLNYGDRHQIANDLVEGNVVERHLADNDVVLFNRQPSLHKLSLMAHRARIMPWRTLRFNECVCAPYNADFDGDEMNIHVPQTEEAKAEAIELMGVQNNLVSPGQGDLVVSPTQDFLSAMYIITRKNMFFDRAQFCQIVSWLGDACEHVDLPPPAIIKPLELWTGKQVMGVMLRPQKKSPYFVTFTVKTKNASKYDGPDSEAFMEPLDGWVIFQNSELLCGTLNKQIMGGGKKSLLYVILRFYGAAVARECMGRIAKVSARFLGNWGFSIGIDDVTPSPPLSKEKNRLVQKGYDDVTDFIREYQRGEMDCLPGMNMEASLEVHIQNRLSSIRGEAGDACVADMHWLNAPKIMTLSGSKGSSINIAQMVACVGQQVVNGQRIPEGFVDRSLPHFAIKAKEPPARGFVANSFYSGLQPTEFFFHTITGREGLVDTAVKTAETGYMQRRLTKAMEDLSVKYDGSCRNSCGDLVQFTYGDDQLDPTDLDDQNTGVDFGRVLEWVRARFPPREDEGVPSAEYEAVVDDILRGKHTGAKWVGQVKEFLAKEKKKVDALELDTLEGADLLMVERKICITRKQLIRFLKTCQVRLERAVIEPGTACGALGAQSIGEPGTQMTLKTFHFAGVASMNVTMGVPRIKEIINAAKTVSTPIIEVHLESNLCPVAANIVKGRIEKTHLSQIVAFIQEVYTTDMCYLRVKLDFDLIHKRALEVTAEQVQRAILACKMPKGVKLGTRNVVMEGTEEIRIYPSRMSREAMLSEIQVLKKRIPHVIVCGIPEIKRSVIAEEKKEGEPTKYRILASGLGMLAVMATSGVKGCATFSNHIMEVEKHLGIEAARNMIIKEIRSIFGSYGINIDVRHVNLLADTMTYRGEVLGITRFGIEKMRDSVLMLASFEKTADHLFDAAVRGRVDTIDGVSECIIMGNIVPLGTGFFKLLHRVHGEKPPSRGAPLLARRPQVPGI